MLWLQVMSAPTGRLGILLSEADLYICSSGEWSADAKSADEVEVRAVAPVARARFQVTFHEIAWALNRLAILPMTTMCSQPVNVGGTQKRTACIPPFGAARGAPSLPRVHSSHRIFGVQDRSRGAPCAGLQLCAASMLPRNMSL